MQYPEIFKTKIAIELLQTHSPKEICKKYSLSKSTIYKWLNKYKTQPSFNIDEVQKTIISLKQENRQLKRKLKILYTSHCSPSSPEFFKVETIKKLSKKFNIKELCDFFNIDRNRYYRQINKTDSKTKKNELLTSLVIKTFNEHKARYGSKRISAALKKEGYIISFQKVSIILKENNLKVATSKRKRKTKTHDTTIHDVLKTKYAIYSPDIVWSSDITEIIVCGVKFYICVIEDLFSRFIISYKISTCNDLELLVSTFNDAFINRNKPKDLILHSDNGPTYKSARFSEYLKTCGVKQSFSRIMHPKDNSLMESFFSTLKKEEIYRYNYTSTEEFFTSIKEYMAYYNTKRLHSKLGYNTPQEMLNKTFSDIDLPF